MKFSIEHFDITNEGKIKEKPIFKLESNVNELVIVVKEKEEPTKDSEKRSKEIEKPIKDIEKLTKGEKEPFKRG